jgi:hypothetical protein
LLIDLYAIRYARVGICKHSSIRKSLSSRVDIVRITERVKSEYAHGSVIKIDWIPTLSQVEFDCCLEYLLQLQCLCWKLNGTLKI